MSATDI